MKKILLLCILHLTAITLYAQYPFKDTSLSVESRIDDLLKRLTIEEKANMMLYNSKAIERLGIPEYNWWNEALHGVARNGKATVFPQAIGLAATFDPELIETVANAISDEARAKYNASIKAGIRGQYSGLTFWSPNVNIFRDPRWGRGQETYGEDPFLSGTIGRAFVRGMQGYDSKYLKTAACAKHFVVHSGPEKIRHSFDATVNERDFRDTYLPAFRMLVDENVEAIMCAYNRTNTEPCCGSKYLLNDILRKEFKFKGHIVTDCWALADFINGHKIAKDEVEAATMAIKAGVNLNCGYVYRFIPDAVKQGKITGKEVDQALRTLLRTRFKLGLFDSIPSDPWAGYSPAYVSSSFHKVLARVSAGKSVVLLKNNSVLPLNHKIKSLYVTGPTANDAEMLLGNYNGIPDEIVTILEGIMRKIGVETQLQYHRGCGITTFANNGVDIAATSEATIVCLGLNSEMEGEAGDAIFSDNDGDRNRISLPESQIKFLQELKKNAGKKPLIVVLTGGSAITIEEIEPLADAILMVWYPGEQGGNAVADVLFGDRNPSGRLPITFYKSVNDLPPFENYAMKGRTYRYFTGEVRYPFGFGLSYSAFSYNNLTLDKTKIKAGETTRVKVEVTNISKISGEEVVQLYIRKNNSKIVRPVKELKGFRNVMIPAGYTQTVTFELTPKLFEYYDTEKKQYTIEKGSYTLYVGKSSDEKDLTKVELEIK